MDKKIEGKKMSKWLGKPLVAAISFLAVAGVYALASSQDGGKTQNIQLDGLTLSKVKSGSFSDTLNARGIVMPTTTVYLDSVAGGRVEERTVEQGTYVNKGQPLLRLSNNSLQLDVISREAQISEQLNLLRNTQMMAETNRLNLQRELLENDNEIQHLKRKINKLSVLTANNYYAKDQLAEMKQNLAYYEQRKMLNIQRQEQEENIRTIQIKQLQESAVMLQKNLKFARQNLDNLTVKAPISGYLSELVVSLGESKPVGSRLGQIDIPGQYKVLASLDEYYLNLVAVGMPVTVNINQDSVIASISKIDSRVNKAQFTVEVQLPKSLTNGQPSNNQSQSIKRGQSLDIDISLSDDTQNALLIKRGTFINNTGGHWVYLVDQESKTAQRRTIKLGKKNQNNIQVLSGLNVGDVVITSSYKNFDQSDNLIFN